MVMFFNLRCIRFLFQTILRAVFQAVYPACRTVERAVKETLVCSTFPCILSGKLMSYSLSKEEI